MAREKICQVEEDGRRVIVYAGKRAIEVEVYQGETGSRTRYSVEQRCSQFYLSIVKVQKEQEQATRVNSRLLGISHFQEALTEAIEQIADLEKEVDIRAIREGLMKALLDKENTNN